MNTMRASLLEAVFRHIAETRMAGLPILNPALGVEALGFRSWQDGLTGVLITPWFMNLVCLPETSSTWPRMDSGSTHLRALPGGEFEFLAAREETLGPYLSCSLISPMHDFADMDAARAVAEAILQLLFAPVAAMPAATDVPAPGTPAQPLPPTLGEKLDKPVSRRGFLSALLPGDRQT